ncbi:MAG: LLM class flavin-dependent oxidoreductase [Actinobacteria bacterium]|nr:LLM class flavin-dependent oxidoreductase [Actinomycetota bacterium]
MRFGLALPHYDFSLPDGEPISFRAMAERAQEAERIGFDSVWISDHFFYSFARYGASPAPLGSLEPMTALAGVAALTERIRIGTLVLCAPFRHPALVAKMAATIDRISGGRLDLGVGAGWFEEEFVAFGYGFGSVGERFARLESTLRVLTASFEDAPATLDAESVRVRGARLQPAPVQEPRPPVWLGAKGGDRSLRLAARHADGWNTVWRWSPEAYAGRVAAARAACEAEGRDPGSLRLSVGLYSLVTEDERDLRPLFESAREGFPGDAMRSETLDAWLRDTLSGTPERVIERVREFEALGVEEIVISPWVLPFAVPKPEMLRVFSEAVIVPLRGTG